MKDDEEDDIEEPPGEEEPATVNPMKSRNDNPVDFGEWKRTHERTPRRDNRSPLQRALDALDINSDSNRATGKQTLPYKVARNEGERKP
jgi:hypothetical protein